MVKAIGGIVVTVIGAVIVYLLIGDNGLLNKKEPVTLGGDIKQVSLANSSPCCTYSVQVEIEGLKDQQCQVIATIVDSGSGLTGQPFPIGWFQPEADKDKASADLDVPFTQAGSYYVHFSLVDPKGVELDSQDTDAITVG